MEPLNKLEAHFKRLSHFQHLAAICGWDQATMMPDGGNTARRMQWLSSRYIVTNN